MKIFLAVCVILIATLAYNNRQEFLQQKARHEIQFVPSIDDVYNAIHNENTALLKKLFDAGVGMEDANIWTHVDVETNETYDIKGLTPLGYAVYMKKPQSAVWLIDNGADINVKMPVGGNVLSWAILYRMTNVIDKLFKREGLNIEIDYNPADHARSLGHEDIVQQLASYGIYPKRENKPQIPLQPKKEKTVFELKSTKKTLEK